MSEEAVSAIRRDPSSAPMELSIVTTSKCNLDCSFCGGVGYMDVKDSARDVQREKLFETLEAHPTIQQINWTGGEPLLAINKIQDFMAELKERYPHLQHEMYTNGLRLTPAQLPVLKQMDRIFVSFDGYAESERPLLRIAEERRYDAFEVFDALDNITLWSVITRAQLAPKHWFLDLLKLHEALYHYKFNGYRVMFDNFMPKPLNQDLVMNFMYGYNKMHDQLTELNNLNGFHQTLSINKFFSQHCDDCSNLVWVKSDATFDQSDNALDVLSSGCNRLAEVIGYDAYQYINRVVQAGLNRNA
ncbi:radical SAM domain-containing protein [Erwinia phage vB_EamM_Asesino]|uniref:Radical SAM superfamily protein n=1 Tax=Erwinia phage vB_EamM_Asesino TaxID=1883370 RepID=A0A1B2IAE1_9CAUD|nr:radical SAM domain-containing protein [Erwinia phage vB_EamM_Asesino]ANZ48194.1 putative radical SAM superfamily protein [Erwinia phage vB_EamM_Asesino]